MKLNKIDVLPGDNGNGKIIHQNLATDNNKSPKQTTVTAFSIELYDELVKYCRSNVQYFGCEKDTATNRRFLDAFRKILQHIEIVRKLVTEICGFAHEYDFDEMTPASGYRSIVKVTHVYIKHTVKVSKYIAEKRNSFLFRRRAYLR